MKALTIRQQANRIKKILSKALDSEIAEGRSWYKDAHNFALSVTKEYDVTLKQACQLISLLSPQKKWEQNKADVLLFLEGETDGIFSTKKTLQECADVIDNGFEIPERRMKTFAFAKCIEEALNNESDPVVIDRHAIKIAFGQMSAKAIIITDKRYKDAREAYIQVANETGIKAHEIQAITWVTYKRIVNR
jgi:hypothetical protein